MNGELDWKIAEEHLNNIERVIQEASNMPKVNMAFYAMGFYALKSRFVSGERTAELYREIMEMH